MLIREKYSTPWVKKSSIFIEESILNSSIVVGGDSYTPGIEEEVVQKKEDEWVFDYED